MSNFYPFFTNDGSVGLYSEEDDDIYHCAYGALTESWQKFILPSTMADLIENNNDIKILDICYGIGYNTKSALQFYLNEYNKKNKISLTKKINLKFLKIFFIIFYFSKKISKKISNMIHNIVTIYTDNNEEKSNHKKSNIATIDGDKNLSSNKKIFSILNRKKSTSINRNIVAIHSDNIKEDKKKIYANKYCKKIKFSKLSKVEKIFYRVNNIEFPKILIDAVDINTTLMNISPCITNKLKKNNFKKYNNNLNSEKILQIKKIISSKPIELKKSYKISDDVLFLIAKNLIDKNHDLLSNENVKNILLNKKNKPYFSKNTINFIKFYSNSRYKSNPKGNKSTFLHNIYYQYISKSYKFIKKLSNSNLINLNFAAGDARNYILNSHNNYNIIFLDAFTPSKCPTLWTQDFMLQLYSHLEDNGIVLTYSSSAAIRNAFIKVGFYVGKIYDKSLDKFIGTFATKNKSLIKHSLSEKDIALINSKAGIPYRDKSLNFDVKYILEERQKECDNSNLLSSSKALKGLNDEK